jgi:putative ABC transport system permease protein
MCENPASRGDNWLGAQDFNTYLLLRPGTDVKKLGRELDALIDRHTAPQLTAAVHQSLAEFKKSGAFIRGNLIKLTDIHLHSNRVAELDGNGNILYIYIFSAIALFILAIACVNFMNLSTARAANRAKEVGIRKVMGSLKHNLVFQFLFESILIAFVALGLGLLMAALALPYFNQLSGKEIASAGLFRPAMLGFLFFLILVVGILAGSYPAFFLAAFRPVEVLKGKLAGGFRRSWLRNSLVVFQFAISIILIIGTLVIENQMKYIRNRDVGYDRNQVLVIDHTEVFGNNTPAFRNELLHINGVRSASMTPYVPTGYWNNGNSFFTSPAKDPQTAINMHVWTVDEAYIPTLGMKMEEGRNFSSQFPTDSTGLILNEAAYRFLGSPNIATKMLYAFVNPTTTKPYHIIGVVKNFNFNSMREVVSPLCLMLGTANQNVSVRINAGDIPAVTERIKQLWRRMAPGQPFGYTFLDDSFNRLYSAEMRTGRIAFTFAILAILIACLGLFGLVTLAVEQRTKEIGIRKVLGAGTNSIVGMVTKDFLVLVGVASLIAFPIAGWGMSRWLQGFAYRVGLEWWIFALAGVIALLIAVLTVGFRALNAAMINPAKTLRAE